MSVISTDELRVVAQAQFDAAYEIAHQHIRFSLTENVERYERVKKAAKVLMIGNLPRYSRMRNAWGYAGRGVVLAVDLRGSSARAERIRARDTYITMHTLVPTMAFVAEKFGGKIVSLRGDGFFATFGFEENPTERTWPEFGGYLIDAAVCGKAMIEAVDEIVNPILEEGEIEGGLRIGVGIDLGEIVVTKIGWRDAQEVTTYGSVINNINKTMRGDNEVILSEFAFECYPKWPEGRIFTRNEGDNVALVFPYDIRMLGE